MIKPLTVNVLLESAEKLWTGTHFLEANAGVQPSILCELSRLAEAQVKLHCSLLNPSPDCGSAVRNTAAPSSSSSSSSYTASPSAPRAKNTRLKTLWRPQLLLWAAKAGWSLLEPDPATLHQTRDPSWHERLSHGTRGRWKRRPGGAAGRETAQLRGALGGDLGRTSSVKHLFMTNLLSELRLLAGRRRAEVQVTTKTASLWP